ncbi:MAG TPA: molybdopterin molybdotransferase MoeA [Candidatus Rubrimentiphilum sp.]|nr:molybdopterin molybdotransferase MoeA [Candidatus Rubrimentiphilum sp.]
MRGLQSDLQTIGFRNGALLAPEQALALFFSRAQLRERAVENVAFEAAAGRVLAKPVIADAAYPAAARSAMDGFAVRSRELPGTLRIEGEIRMGQPWAGEPGTGSAIRIPTGGSLPAGADCVVPVEDARVDGGDVRIETAVAAGANVVPAGSDMRAGETLLEEGRRIGGAELGVIAALGIATVAVYAVPVFGIVSSGDEIVDVRAKPGPAQVRDSNRWALAAKVGQFGAAAKHYPIAPDDEAGYARILQDAVAQCDGVILSGGSSVGLRDLTPRLVERSGPPGVIVHGLRVKPGKPTLLASAQGKPVIGLPGNPASALMILEAVAGAIVAQCAGAFPQRSEVRAELASPVRKRLGWTQFVPVRLEETGGIWTAFPLDMHSASVSVLARASGFLTLGETVESAAAGETVTAMRFL